MNKFLYFLFTWGIYFVLIMLIYFYYREMLKKRTAEMEKMFIDSTDKWMKCIHDLVHKYEDTIEEQYIRIMELYDENEKLRKQLEGMNNGNQM